MEKSIKGDLVNLSKEEKIEIIQIWMNTCSAHNFQCVLCKNIEKCKQIKEEIRRLIESQPEVDEEFIEKWALRIEVSPFAPTGIAPFEYLKQNFLIPMLQEAGVRIKEKK